MFLPFSLSFFLLFSPAFIGININKDNLKNIDIDMVILENIAIDIDKEILQNIDID